MRGLFAPSHEVTRLTVCGQETLLKQTDQKHRRTASLQRHNCTILSRLTILQSGVGVKHESADTLWFVLFLLSVVTPRLSCITRPLCSPLCPPTCCSMHRSSLPVWRPLCSHAGSQLGHDFSWVWIDFYFSPRITPGNKDVLWTLWLCKL